MEVMDTTIVQYRWPESPTVGSLSTNLGYTFCFFSLNGKLFFFICDFFFKSRRNIISLDIYFEDLSYEIIQQTPVYETWTMIGKSGSLENLANCHNCSELSYNYQLIFSILAIFLKVRGEGRGQMVDSLQRRIINCD